MGDGFVGESRIQNKYGQVISVSPAKSGISGGNFRSGEPITIPSNWEDRENSIFLPSKTAGYCCFKEGIRETGGISQLRGKLPAIGKTLFDSHYGMVEYQHLHEVQGSSSLARPTIKGRSDSLDRARVSEIPGSHAPGSSLNPDYDRCVRRGLGGSIASSPSLGNLESGGKALFNELEGVESRVSHSDIFPRPSEGQICQGAFRQLHHGGLPEKAGFSGIPITLGTHKRHLSNVRGLEHFTVSPPPKRSSQRSGRQTVEKFNHSHGVESRQSNVLKALCHTGSTSSGSVRHKEQYPAPCVHFPLSRSGSSGLRCTQSGLGKLEVYIRLSPNSDLARGRLEVEHVHRDRVPDCPFLANRQLVPVAFGEVPSQLPSSSAPLAITDNIVRTSMVQSGGVFKPSRMETLNDAFVRQGFDQNAIDLMSREHKASTLTQYQGVWSKFLSYLQVRSISYDKVLLTTVFNFLAEQVKVNNRAFNTIGAYRCALKHPLFYTINLDIDSRHSESFMKGLYATKPTDRNSNFPLWSLSDLLEYLKGDPFEPLFQASWSNLTKKTYALILLSSGRRSSEVAAISRSSVIRGRYISLPWVKGFRAKYDSENFRPEDPSISKLISNVEGENLLCPVRAWRIFSLRRSTINCRRDNNECLWPLSQKSLNYMFSSLVKKARPFAGHADPIPIGTHQMKKFAASYCRFFMDGKDEILFRKMGCKSMTVLKKCYIRYVEPLSFTCVLPLGTLKATDG